MTPTHSSCRGGIQQSVASHFPFPDTVWWLQGSDGTAPVSALQSDTTQPHAAQHGEQRAPPEISYLHTARLHSCTRLRSASPVLRSSYSPFAAALDRPWLASTETPPTLLRLRQQQRGKMTGEIRWLGVSSLSLQLQMHGEGFVVYLTSSLPY